EMGLRQLTYPINKRSSGIYFCIEFSNESGAVVDKLELALRRDERIMRFLTISLDKYGVKYNDDKRKGLIGKVQKKVKGKKDETPNRAPAPTPVAEKAVEAVVAEEVVAPVIVPEVIAPVAPVVEEVAVANEEE
ncbi:MAG TPA: 30S ribosomal protein S6, partial [Saprospiraceae bacterium]|nr:30S ribosomal protein S6 [Saprospiraceae bacterium]